ncbi:MAG TPA: Clp protease N-terminal domain-containing protein [Euzebyales bacterium]|nr:Clp protease N-terminal domain-containing protein [Euzebyales bacterium]
MLERFTDEARRVVVIAQEEARGLDHAQIGTEHLLLGLVHEEGSEVTRVLVELGVDVRALEHAVHAVVGRGVDPSPSHLPFTRQAKESLELALRESLQLGDKEIRPTHILCGLLREGDGVAVTVLTRQGVDLDEVRTIVKRPPERAMSSPRPRRGLRRWFRWEDDEPPAQVPLLVERLDDPAWDAVIAARRVARVHGVAAVDAHQLLIGIAATKGPGADALRALGQDARSLSDVDVVGEARPDDSSPAALPFSEAVRTALRWAGDEAERRGDDAAGTAHLLLGLLIRIDGVDEQAAYVLDAVGVSHDDLRDETARQLDRTGPRPSTTDGP